MRFCKMARLLQSSLEQDAPCLTGRTLSGESVPEEDKRLHDARLSVSISSSSNSLFNLKVSIHVHNNQKQSAFSQASNLILLQTTLPPSYKPNPIPQNPQTQAKCASNSPPPSSPSSPPRPPPPLASIAKALSYAEATARRT